MCVYICIYIYTHTHIYIYCAKPLLLMNILFVLPSHVCVVFTQVSLLGAALGVPDANGSNKKGFK